MDEDDGRLFDVEIGGPALRRPSEEPLTGNGSAVRHEGSPKSLASAQGQASFPERRGSFTPLDPAELGEGKPMYGSQYVQRHRPPA